MSSNIVSILLIIFMLSAGHINAQTDGAYLEGTVKDVFGHGLPGATVKTKNNAINTVSGVDGAFTIKEAFPEEEELYVSLDGYRTKVVTFEGQDSFSVILETDVSGRDNTVSLLTGDRTMSSVGASAVTISQDVLSRTKTSTLGSALLGRFPGYTSGYIRGISTTNGKAPIILVDGMVTNSYNHINLNDVESVTILKDAAATSLYGLQGGNGIISVKTKKGYDGESTITVNTNYTMQTPITTPTVLNSGQYTRLYNEAWVNDGNTDPSIYTEEDIRNYESGENRELYPNNNWYDMFINSLVETQDINISGRGGSEVFKYYVGMGYLHQNSPYITDGTVPEKYGTNRFDIRSNLDIKINDYISGYMNISGRINRTMNPQANNIYSTIFNLGPTVYGPLTPEGNVVVTETEGNSTYAKINRAGYVKTTGVHISSISGLNFDLNKLLPGLSTGGEIKYYTVPTSYIYGNTDYERWIRDMTIKDDLVFMRFGNARNEPVTFTKSTSSSYRTEYQGHLKYKNTFGNHNINATALIQKQYYNSQAAEGVQPFIKMTYGFNANYAYKNLLFTDFVSGYQGSEQFSADNRYGFFPSASTALVLSNFDFLKDDKAVTFLKLRGSYGLVGNDNIAGNNRFLYKDNLTTGGNNIGEDQLGNPNITWETSRIANIGFDIGLWDQLSLSFEYFDDRRTDILVSNNIIPAMLGVSSSSLPLMNDGEVHSYGYEAQLGYKKDFNKDFSLGVNGYFAFNDNKVENIAELNLGDDYAYPYRTTGYRVGQKWGYLIDYSNGNGYFNSADEITASGLAYEGASPRPGDFIYQDLNNDGVINVQDIAPMGYSSIPRISYGTELSMKWNRFDVSALFFGVAQVSTFNSGAGFYESFNNGTFFTQHLNAWTADRYANGEEITAPALSLNGSASHKANDYYFQDKSYLQLREVTVSYTIPADVSNKIWSKEAQVYFSGRNLFNIDNMKSDDLTVFMNSTNSAPTRRAFVLGLNLTF
ncbi:SusC/RagA family TonB-linked outer membrane protein [Arenibacter aquaticus]|nr:SusC/RagA family TonB-linked outer membrane protein [Arenibacter aquaticus]